MFELSHLGHAESALVLSPVLADLGEGAGKAFLDFFTSQIRNRNTRLAYGRAVFRFLGWVEARGMRLSQVEPVHVASYVESLGLAKKLGGGGFSVASVKQHLSALKMLGSFLVIRQILPENPALVVRSPKLVVRTGKTPVLEGTDCRQLFDALQGDSPAEIRDRALLGIMTYTFARVSAVLTLEVADYFQVGRRMIFRFQEKGGRHHEMPAHHTLVEYMDAYLALLGTTEGPLFRSINRKRNGLTQNRLNRREALAMVKRRCRNAGLGDRFANHTFRATGITTYLKNGGQLEHAQFMAAHASPRTTKLYDRRAEEASLDEVERIIF